MNPDGTVNRAALPAIFNPEDLYAVELALEIRDRFGGGKVTVITMGPPAACEALRQALYRGADEVVLVTDRRAAASDTLATSYILSCAVRKCGQVDVVLCGRQAIDGDTAQVGPQLAEKLNLPQVTYVEQLQDIKDGVVRIRRNVGNGYEIVEGRLPMLLTVLDTAGHPRPAAARRLMKYKKARAKLELEAAVTAEMPNATAEGKATEVARRLADLQNRGLIIHQWNLDDIKADLQWCGRDGSPTKVHRIQSVILTGKGHKGILPTDEGVAELVTELIEDHTIS
jgi:electron transfer flavoprotein beta subunit